jgi:hypothetical protein
MRYLYLLQRHKAGDVKLVMAVKVYGAYRKEQSLHDKFSCSRFTISRRFPVNRWGQGVYKIGIATNVKSRVASINKDINSGKTEWFLLTPAEVGFVLAWMRWYKLRPYINALVGLLLALLFAGCYVAEMIL